MRAAYVEGDHVPRVGQFEEPSADDRGEVMTVRAAALTNLDVLVATGRHYMSPARFPTVIGREAVVEDENGHRFFATVKAIAAPFGSMAERAPVDRHHLLRVPEGIDDVRAAALGNAGLAAWLPLSWRARLRPGETVLILGATGATGLLAVASAAILGAGQVIAAGRNAAALERATVLGATRTILLDGSGDLAARLRAEVGEVDVVIDYLNGSAAEAALPVLAEGGRMVQVGSIAGSATRLDAQIARRNCLEVLGFAYYHAPVDQQAEAYRQVVEHAMAGRLAIDHELFALSGFEQAWTRQRSGERTRLIMVPDRP